jgi:hypothetical protein
MFVLVVLLYSENNMWIASSYIVLIIIIQSKFDYDMKLFNVDQRYNYTTKVF